MTAKNKFLITKAAFAALTALMILCAGCSRRPKEVLGEKKMVKLMADMELAEAYANMSNHGGSRNSDYRYELGQSVLAAHGVTQEQLDTTLAWYGRNLDDYSDLYAKVDKEIIARKKKLLNMTDEEMEMLESDILWKFGKNGLLSDLGNTDSWIFSVADPELQKGDRLQWSMHIDAPVQFNGVLGVEYADGSSEASSNVFIGRNRLEMTLQTDSGKTVKRVYGTMRVKDSDALPLFADSITVVRLPFDSVEYRMSRGLKRYGIPVVRKKNKKEPADSIDVKEEPLEVIHEAVEPEKGKNVGRPVREKPKMWHGSIPRNDPSAPQPHRRVNAPRHDNDRAIDKKPRRRER